MTHFTVGDTAVLRSNSLAAVAEVVGVRDGQVAVIWDHDRAAGPTGWIDADRFDRQPAVTPTPSTDALAEAVSSAVAMLDREEHRYVERFTACPNGCQYDPVGDPPRRIAGPAECDVDCDYGVIEDEDAPWLNPFLDVLREAAAALARAGEPLL